MCPETFLGHGENMVSGYLDALSTIHGRSDYGRGYVSDPHWGDDAARLGLRRMTALLERLGRPDRLYPIMHVAGSKGKGSTCIFADSILSAAGYKVGLTTSPHLHTFRERIVVAGKMIGETAFADLVTRAESAATSIESLQPNLGRVTAFELLTAMALDHFAASACDVAVVEVGMGGELDSTNVVSSSVSVITALDYEHTAVLGDRLPDIAENKAGIIKPGRPVLVANQQAEALAVIQEIAARRGSRMFVAGQHWHMAGNWRDLAAEGPWGRLSGLRLGLAGDHQAVNAGLALAAVTKFLRGIETRDTWEAAVRTGLASASLAGRFEEVDVWGRTAVLDGAHSPASARSLAKTLGDAFPGRPMVMVVGIAADKRVDEFVDALSGAACHVIATRSRSPRAAETGEIVDAFQQRGVPVQTAAGVAAAISEACAVASDNAILVVTGSFGVVAEAREAFGLATADPAGV